MASRTAIITTNSTHRPPFIILAAKWRFIILNLWRSSGICKNEKSEPAERAAFGPDRSSLSKAALRNSDGVVCWSCKLKVA